MAVAAAALAVAVSACGTSNDGGSKSSSAGGSGTQAPAGDGAQAAKDAQARLELWWKGPSGGPPATSPKPQPGKNVWVITYGQNSTAGAVAVDGAKEAGKALGWKVTGFDGKFSSATYLAGVRAAIDARADAIYLYAIDCSTVKSGLEQAKAKNIPVVAAESYDCNQTTNGAKSLYTGQLKYDPSVSDKRFFAFDDFLKTTEYPALAYSMGAAQADWLIAKIGSSAKVIQMTEIANQADADIAKGFVKQFTGGCPTCKILQNVEYQPTEYGPGLQQKTQQALLAHPDAQGIFGHYDSPVTSGIAAGVRAAGKLKKVFVTGGEGDPPNVALVRNDNGQAMGSGYSVAWESWAALDAINRIFHNAPIASSGIGIKTWDKNHNLPATDTYPAPPVDFRAAYKKAWGVQ